MRAVVLCVGFAAAAGCGKKDEESGGGPPGARSGAEPGAEAAREPVARLDALALFEEYARNPLAADERYKGKVVEVTGTGQIGTEAGDRYSFGFVVIVFPGMTPAQLARLAPRERQWFRDGSYPPNVVARLSKAGERAGASHTPGRRVAVVGTVKGSKAAEAWRDYVVELDECSLRLTDGADAPAKTAPPRKDKNREK